MDIQMLYTPLMGLAAFAAVICLWLMGVIVWASAKEKRTKVLGRRLGIEGGELEDGRTLRLWLDGKEVETAVSRSSHKSMSAQFASMCHDAGWEAPPSTVLLIGLGLMLGAFVVVFALSTNLVVSSGAALVVAAGSWLYVKARIHRRRTLFENQLVDALELAARSLRVGHPLVNALRLVSEEVGSPIGPMFAAIVQQQELGAPMDRALRMTADNSGSDDLKLFATAVIIQLRSGGNLADMMDRVASVIRDRLRLSRRVKVLIAQAQFSKSILLALPVFMFVLLQWMNPGYMSILQNTVPGRMILGVAVVLMVVGTLLMNKIAQIRY